MKFYTFIYESLENIIGHYVFYPKYSSKLSIDGIFGLHYIHQLKRENYLKFIYFPLCVYVYECKMILSIFNNGRFSA